MTTIVYRDGILAGDGRMTSTEWITPGSAVKVIKYEGHLAGVTGDLTKSGTFFRWVWEGMHRPGIPKLGDHSRGILVHPNGQVEVFEDDDSRILPGDAPFYAWGSGFPVALGALYMGATAVQAVEIAAKVDSSTGGLVHSVQLGQDELEKLTGYIRETTARQQDLIDQQRTIRPPWSAPF